MIVNPGVARFQQFAHETVAQMQDTLRTFQRVVGPSCRTHLTFLIEAMRQRVDFLRRKANHCCAHFVKGLTKPSPVKVI